MRIRWYGQSAFLINGERTVFIDPFGAMEGLAERGMQFDYPPIGDVQADLLLVTHEHGDHNAVEVVGGSPQILRSTAGTFDSPAGTVIGVASEHDDSAGTERGPNTIFCFTLDGLRLCHFGDFGQAGLRVEQARAIGEVDVLLLPVGGGPTIGGEKAAAISRALGPRLVVPMHYRTDAVNFLGPPDSFLAALGARVERIDGNELEAEQLLGTADEPTVHAQGARAGAWLAAIHAAGSRTLRIPASRNAPKRIACKADRMPIRCLIVDDNQPFLEAARVLLEREGLSVAGVAMTSEEAVGQAESLRPDVVLVDISLGEESGLDLAQRLVEDGLGTEATVVLISTRAEEDVADLVAVSPAAGFLPKAELSAAAIRRIVDGNASARRER